MAGGHGRSIVVGFGAALSACSSPAPQADFDSADPVERTMAAADAIRSGDRSSVPELVAMLDSEDPAVRLIAIGGLEQLTGETFGYDYAAPEAKRQPAIDRWVEWVNTSHAPADVGEGS